ncbi:MAG TPA: alkaline phosphatase family protein [Lacunisphaera sp.]|nr:alkaline phosphatase family protein [Lacunisphaera sp.]
MKRHTTACILLLAGLLVTSCSTPAPRPAPADLLILISIDGFRWDYLQKYDAPVLKKLAAEGVHATRMTPSFPSKTFPNHYTLVTGLRPEHHGIVGNWFYDPVIGETFGMSKPESNHDPRWWAEGEPVWVTAEKQGVRSACYFWPGSETENHGRRPAFYKAFDSKVSPAARVDGLFAWLDLPIDQRPRLCTLYFEMVDYAGHKFGPDAPETAAAVLEADKAVGRLLDGLAARGLRDKANLVIVSDHGMSPCGPDKVIFLEDLMDVSQAQVDSTGPCGGVRPLKGSATDLVASIRAKNPAHLQVYLREEVPARLHYRANDRIPPVVLIADDHWNFESKIGWPKRAPTYNIGSHGWDPATPNMGALFIACGPVFQRGVELPDVDNVNVYNLLCAVLGIKPAANDGDRRLVRAALRR